MLDIVVVVASGVSIFRSLLPSASDPINEKCRYDVAAVENWLDDVSHTHYVIVCVMCC